MRFASLRWIGAAAPNRGAVAGAAGWALFLVIVAADCAMEGVALTDTAAVAPAAGLSGSPGGLGRGHRQGPVAVLIRTRGPVGERERRELRAAGVEVAAVAGDVVTGRVRAGCLKQVAELAFVRSVERERRLAPEREQRQ